MKKLTENELIDALTSAANTLTKIYDDDDVEIVAIIQSIEAVKTLKLIADNGKSNSIGYGSDKTEFSGGWCAKQAKAVFND